MTAAAEASLRQKIVELRQCIQHQQDALTRGDLDDLGRYVDHFHELSAQIEHLTRGGLISAYATDPDLSQQLIDLAASQQRLLLDVQLRYNELGNELRTLERQRHLLNNYAPNVGPANNGEAF